MTNNAKTRSKVIALETRGAKDADPATASLVEGIGRARGPTTS